MKFLVLHGPNLNLFGRREPHIYGTMTLAEINQKLEALALRLGVELDILQSNHEGVLVDKLHAGIDTLDGLLMNPAGLTQHGVSRHDAIKAMPFPTFEIHMTNIASREPWRDHSIISSAVKATIQGLGWRSYTAGLYALVDLVRESQPQKP